MRRQFTLVELMIVVAIIAVLAAIAIPSFVYMQYRTKRAEGPLNAEGIRTAQIAFEAAEDRFLFLDETVADFYVPRSALALLASGKQVVTGWPGAPAASPGWDLIGWAPDGAVRCSYWSQPCHTSEACGAITDESDFQIYFACNVDGDAAVARGGCDPCLSNQLAFITAPDTY